MKLTVKTLKGVKFEVEVDDASTIDQVKTAIEQSKPELPAAGMKLIHSGKVLKDGDTVSTCGIKPNDFLVVMVTKPKPATPKPAAAAAAAAPTVDTAAAASTTNADGTSTAVPTPTAASSSSTDGTAAAATPAPSASAASSAAAAAPDAPARATDEVVSAAAVEGLVAMGFPEAEVRHCLRAAGGNPDVAVEFLTNGIPDAVSAALASGGGGGGSAAAASPNAASTSSSSTSTLQSLRQHPQFDALRRLVQTNPAMLQQVLSQIGQQQPDLLQEINDNQALFIQMMNEPIAPAAPVPLPSGGSSTTTTTPRSASSSGGAGAAAPPALGSPAHMAELVQSMSPEEVAQMAAMMGLSPEQLRQTAQVIGSMPPEQLQQFMAQAMGGMGGGGDMDDWMMGGGGGAMGRGRGGPQVLELTAEEMAAVDRLTEMGFDRADAAQAFLACDKNEDMAANLLMDSMNDDDDDNGGGGGYFGSGGDGGGGGGGEDDDADDMYD